MRSPDEKGFFVTGGTLAPGNASYVTRNADEELYKSLKQGEFCYVLNARQMGKSSLMVNTAKRLQKEGIGTVLLDLTSIGQNVTLDQWYLGILAHACDQLNIGDGLEAFWTKNLQFSPHQRWLLTLRRHILPAAKGPLVIFVDEIDMVQSLPFPTDEFFAGIRELHNRRSSDPELEYLTFCLLGVATPAELIKDTDTTPFNIGKRIALADFTFEEAFGLSHGLNHVRDGVTLLKRVFYWTDGHPYLTQRVCKAIALDLDIASAKDVDDLCERMFLSQEGRDQDDNLLFVRDRLLDGAEEEERSLLKMYLHVLSKKPRANSLPAGPLAKITLSGAVKVQSGRVKVRNRLYERAFDRKWVLDRLPGAESRRLRRAFLKGLIRAGLAGGTVSGALLFLTVWSLRERADAEDAAARYQRLAYGSDIALGQQLLDGPVAQPSIIDGLLTEAEHLAGSQHLGWEWHYLYDQAHLLHKIADLPMEPRQWVPPIAALDHDRLLAVADGDSLEFWSVGTGRVVDKMKLPDVAVAMAASTDGGRLAIATHSRILLVDPASKRLFWSAPGNYLSQTNLSFSANGSAFAVTSTTATRSKELKVLAEAFRTADGAKLGSWTLSSEGFSSSPVVFQDGRLLLFSAGENVYAARPGSSLEERYSSSDWPLLVSAGESGPAFLVHRSGAIDEISLPSCKVLRTAIAIGPPDVQEGVAANNWILGLRAHEEFWEIDAKNRRSSHLLIPGSDSLVEVFGTHKLFACDTLGLYDTDPSEMQPFCVQDPNSELLDRAVAFSSDGKQLLLSAENETPLSVDIRSLKVTPLAQETAMIPEIASAGRFVSTPNVVLDGDGTQSAMLQNIVRSEGALYLEETDYSGRKLLTLSQANSAKLWDLDSGQVLAERERVCSATLSNDGKDLAVITDDQDPKSAQEFHDSYGRTLMLWTREEGWRTVQQIGGQYPSLCEAQFSQDDQGLFYLDYRKGTIHETAVPSLQEVRQDDFSKLKPFTFSPLPNRPGIYALALPGNHLAIADSKSVGGNVLLDLAPVGPQAARWVKRIATSPDGTRIAAAYLSGEYYLWSAPPETQSQEPIRTAG